MTTPHDPREAIIQFLVSRKFPRLFDPYGAAARRRRLSRVLNTEEMQAERYASALRALSDAELNGQYKEAVEYERAKSEREEAARPFNQPYARANIEHWAKMSYWTPDEAVALSLGCDPKYAEWEAIKKLLNVSRFANRFAAQREIVTRATAMGQLKVKTAPAHFVAWAERMQFPMPDELIEAVTGLNPPAVDWKALFEQSRSTVEALTARIEELERHKSRAETERLGTRERESLLKLVIGMAVGAYEFHPIHGRRGIAKLIAHDLASAGLPMDEDTVRKYVAAGKELLPRDKTE